MKQLMCEMCGSTDLLKMDGMFVCQNCGTKYSVEEAKKMMIEGTVDVQGTVKVDNTDVVERFLQNAHRAIAKQDWEETEKYYNLVESNQPDNWEAVFYSAYAKVMNLQTDTNRIIPALEVLMHSMDQVIFQVEKMPNDEEAVQLEKFSDEIYEMTKIINENAHNAGSSQQISLSHEIRVRGALAKVHYAFADIVEEKIEKYEKALELIGTNYKRGNAYCPKPFVANGDFLTQHNDTTAYNMAVAKNEELMKKYVEKTKKYDENYQAPSQPGACYVATAVYGSYDCPQVWTLRRYRDYTLAETWYGRAFIYTYYAISPTLVRWFGDTNWFKKMWRGKLDKMVESLKAEGVEDTPYQDRNW